MKYLYIVVAVLVIGAGGFFYFQKDASKKEKQLTTHNETLTKTSNRLEAPTPAEAKEPKEELVTAVQSDAQPEKGDNEINTPSETTNNINDLGVSDWIYQENNRIESHFFKTLETHPNAQMDELECKENECLFNYTVLEKKMSFTQDFMKTYTEQYPDSAVALSNVKPSQAGFKVTLKITKKEP